MKQITQLVFAAILGSVITLVAAYNLLDINAFSKDAEVVSTTLAEAETQQNTSPKKDVSDSSTNAQKPSTASKLSNFIPTFDPKSKARNIPFNFTEAAAKTMPAVVHITAKQTLAKRQPSSRRGGRGGGGMDGFFRDFFGDDFFGEYGRPNRPRVGTGSGVIISADGYIVTNNHVVKDANEIEVSLFDKQTFEATVIGTDPSTDLALIKVEGTDLPKLELANSDEAKVGEWVLAVGNPFNLASTVTAGIVSAKGRNLNILQDKAPIESFIQTDAAVNPGNSGGALVNTDGKLLGINTAIATPTGTYAGYSFAVPANIVEKVVADIKNYGKVQRGFLGVMIRDLDGKLAKELDLDITQGVYVDSLLEDGSAKAAGIEKGDIIVKVDGKKIKSSPMLQEAVGTHRPGDHIAVTVNRGGELKNISIVLRNRAGNTEVVSKEAKSALLGKLGIEVKDLDREEAEKLGIDGGVEITNITRGKISRETDITNGFIITKINDKMVNTIKDLENALADKKGGVLIEGIYPNSPGAYYYGLGM